MDRFERNVCNPCTDIVSNSTSSVDTLDYIDDVLRDLTSYKKAFIDRGIKMIDFLNSKGRINSYHLDEPGSPDVVEQLEGQLCKIINIKHEFTNHWMTNSHKDNRVQTKRLRQLSDVQITEEYRNQQLTSVERFIREYETTLDEYNKTTEGVVIKTTEGGSNKHEIALKGDVNDEDKTSHNLENFLRTCKVFKVKLDDFKNKKNHPTDDESVTTLIDQIDNVMNISKKVEEMGAETSNMEKFIKNCHDFKKLLQIRHNKQKKGKNASKVPSDLVCHYCTDENDLDNQSDVLCNLCCGQKEPPTQTTKKKQKGEPKDFCDQCLSQHSTTTKPESSNESSRGAVGCKRNKPSDGVYRTLRTITKVTRYLNPDGTIQEEREILKIKQVRSDCHDDSRRKKSKRKSKKDRVDSKPRACKGLKEKPNRCDVCGEPAKSISHSTDNYPGTCGHSRSKDKSQTFSINTISKGEQLCSRHQNIMAPKTLRKIYLSNTNSVACDCVGVKKNEMCEICVAEKFMRIYLSKLPNIGTSSDTAMKNAPEDICDQCSTKSSKSLSKCKSEPSPAISNHSDVDQVWLRLCKQCCGKNLQAKKSGIIAKAISCNHSLPSDSVNTVCGSPSQPSCASSISKSLSLKSVSKASCYLCSKGGLPSNISNSEKVHSQGGSEKTCCGETPDEDTDNGSDNNKEELETASCELHSKSEQTNQNVCACTDQTGSCVNKVLCDQCLNKVISKKIEELLKNGKLPKCPHYADPRLCQCCKCPGEGESNEKNKPLDDYVKCDLCCSSAHPSSHRSVTLPPEQVELIKHKDATELIFCPKSGLAFNIEGEICMCKDKDEYNVCKSCKTETEKEICPCPLLKEMYIQNLPGPVPELAARSKVAVCPGPARCAPPETPEVVCCSLGQGTPIPDSKPCSKAPSREDFGLFETKIRVITRVTRFLKSDGTVQERREVITIKHEKHDPEVMEIGNDYSKSYWEDNSAYEIINDITVLYTDDNKETKS